MPEEEQMLKHLQEMMTRKMEESNHAPIAIMDNLSPIDMHHILYDTFEKNSPIGFKKEISNEILDKVPFLNLVIKYLNIVESIGSLKLTTRGNLPRKTCFELYNMGFIKESMIESGIVKLNKEADSKSIQNVKIISNLSGLTKKKNNKISLTIKGKKILAKVSKADLFKTIFQANCQKFNLGFHDGYPQNVGIQHTFGFTIYLLLKHGQTSRELAFFIDKNLAAFPNILDHFTETWTSSDKQYRNCYSYRIFELFLNYYGFINYKKERIAGSFNEAIYLNATKLFYDVFEFKKDQFKFTKSKFQA